ncbi:adenosylcobinamide-GDP ribazoletransferase [Sphaerisporangium melleum]|uniref:Adenosylcobinamide-GDP ribazoletransferase n=1 Tax=Sphaerisporangium melleum TaxID=321316 RepID=A0A917R4D2_9ACTN|nr:adenosylcobinamide-GDP ribazoletransferase [Sphaerisporangium melleum]GGK88310.1 adenosylcobinamide-GDP ribazoletransferase [Sphaerisporangium melleum]GII67659.1 adenosylcobinamide-GDP ribazoletransferase [Sphaerisporangium melleum]
MPPPPASGGPMADGLRLAAGMFTVWPAGLPRTDRVTAGWAMTLAPLIGLPLGLAGAAVMAVAGPLVSPLLAAALALGTLAVLTRGLHLDGLADLADGLGSGKPAEQALDIMKRSDIGPFGVMTLLFTVLLQAAAAAEAGPASLVVACVTGRLAVTWACVAGVPTARPEGLGAMVAGTVRPIAAITATAATAAAALLLGLPLGHPLIFPMAVGAGLCAAWALRAHATRRLGGITGDVLGALVETATAAALIVCAAAA